MQCTEASLATNLVVATPTEQVIPCCSLTWRPDQLADRGRAAEPAQRAGYVQERLIQRERLDLRRDRPEDGHDLPGHGAVVTRAGAG